MELQQENLVLLEQAEKQLRQLSIERLQVAIATCTSSRCGLNSRAKER